MKFIHTHTLQKKKYEKKKENKYVVYNIKITDILFSCKKKNHYRDNLNFLNLAKKKFFSVTRKLNSQSF